MIGLAFLAAAATSGQPSYPSKAVIAEFRAVCDLSDDVVRATSLGPTDVRIADWRKQAEQRGWQAISVSFDAEKNKYSADPSRALDYVVASRMNFIDAMLTVELSMGGNVGTVSGSLFKKAVAGRTLYLSTFANTQDDNGILECRLHDPLGDGMTKLPIKLADVEEVVGTKVMQPKGPYGSTSFYLPYSDKGIKAFDVHIGFKGTGLSSLGPIKGGGDPYAPYGMTFVMTIRDQPDILAIKN